MFVRTLESPENSGLSIVARPGAGKTTAAAFTIRHLSGTQSGAVVYFFCKASDAEKRTSLHILRSLLWQCLQHDGDFYTDMVQWYYRSGRSVADSQTDVGAMFTACLQSKSLPAIYIVIDALDECLDTEDLLLALSNVMASSVRPLRLIIFSREGFDIPTLTSSQMRTIELTGEKCHAAIESYVSERLSAISTLRGLGQDNEIAQSIIDAADGLWLFARLLLDELQHAPSLGEVQRQICGLPHGLRSLYSSILRTKEKGFSDMQLRMAQELYLWIDETEYLPDWARWGGYNDILDGETICSLLNIVIGSKQLLHPPKLVKQLTSPLLEVRTISPASTFNADGVPYDCSDFDVDFFHQTVSQYLKWSVHAASTDLPQSLIPRRLGPLYRGVTAARYLSQSLEFKDNLQQLRERPRNGMFPNYLDMVYGLWGALKLSEMRWDLDGEEVIKAGYLCDQLTQFLSTDKCLGWIEAAVIINYARQCTKLIENVENVLEIDSDALSSTPAFHRFHCARQTFMGDYIYALASTWPKNDLPAETGARVGKTPYGFYQRPLARKIMALVRQYQWLLTPAQARSSNCFSFDCRS